MSGRKLLKEIRCCTISAPSLAISMKRTEQAERLRFKKALLVGCIAASRCGDENAERFFKQLLFGKISTTMGLCDACSAFGGVDNTVSLSSSLSEDELSESDVFADVASVFASPSDELLSDTSCAACFSSDAALSTAGVT